MTFLFYGLVGWEGPRWVKFFEVASDHPVATLRLGHHRRDSRDHFSVGSSTDSGVPDIDTGVRAHRADAPGPIDRAAADLATHSDRKSPTTAGQTRKPSSTQP